MLGPPDLTWPGGLSMPPAARLARGFCSPRSYLSIAVRPYTRPLQVRKRLGAGRGRMLEEVGEPLGSVGRIPWHARRDGARDDGGDPRT